MFTKKEKNKISVSELANMMGLTRGTVHEIYLRKGRIKPTGIIKNGKKQSYYFSISNAKTICKKYKENKL